MWVEGPFVEECWTIVDRQVCSAVTVQHGDMWPCHKAHNLCALGVVWLGAGSRGGGAGPNPPRKPVTERDLWGSECVLMPPDEWHTGSHSRLCCLTGDSVSRCCGTGTRNSWRRFLSQIPICLQGNYSDGWLDKFPVPWWGNFLISSSLSFKISLVFLFLFSISLLTL